VDAKMKIIRSEFEFSKWFKKNFRKLGYDKIIRGDKGKFPDYIMLKKGKETRVELETLSSHFILHKHDPKKIDEVVCIEEDIKLNVPVIKVKGLKYKSRIVRISFTVDQETKNLLEVLVKKGNYRNKSHVIENAIKQMKEKI